MKIRKGSFRLSNGVYFKSGYTIVGKKEEDGNFAGNFDLVLKNDLWGEKSYEKAECKMHREAISGAIAKANLTRDDVDIMLAGDLLNELSASSLAARNFPTSFLGLYNACSTFGECVLVGSMLIDGGFADVVTCSTSSQKNRNTENKLIKGVCENKKGSEYRPPLFFSWETSVVLVRN